MRRTFRQWSDTLRRGGTDGADEGYGPRWEFVALAGLAAALLLVCCLTWFRASADGVTGTATETGWGSHGIAGPVLLVGAGWLIVFGAGLARGGWGPNRIRVTPSDLGHGAMTVGGVLTATYLLRLVSPPRFAEVRTTTYGVDMGVDSGAAVTTTRTGAVWLALLIAIAILAIGTRLVLELRAKVRPHQLYRAFGTDAVLRGEPVVVPPAQR